MIITSPGIARDIQTIRDLLRTFTWFHYARWSTDENRILVLCGPASDPGDGYNPAFAPSQKVIREVIGPIDTAFSILYMG